MESRRDKSGFGCARNRYYHLQSGGFTQEDPIGVAGALNLCGFDAGDPINFSDPFGLDACSDHDRQDHWNYTRVMFLGGMPFVMREWHDCLAERKAHEAGGARLLGMSVAMTGLEFLGRLFGPPEAGPEALVLAPFALAGGLGGRVIFSGNKVSSAERLY